MCVHRSMQVIADVCDRLIILQPAQLRMMFVPEDGICMISSLWKGSIAVGTVRSVQLNIKPDTSRDWWRSPNGHAYVRISSVDKFALVRMSGKKS